MKDQLLSKIHGHSATVAIIGLGYVGLPLAGALRSGRERLPRGRHRRRPQQGGRDQPGVAIICVPTPLNKTRDPDVRYHDP